MNELFNKMKIKFVQSISQPVAELILSCLYVSIGYSTAIKCGLLVILLQYSVVLKEQNRHSFQ